MASRMPRSIFSFSSMARRWTPIMPQRPHKAGLRSRVNFGEDFNHRLEIVSWNINAYDSQPSRRCMKIIDYVLSWYEMGGPDIICLQEVRPSVRATLLSDSRIQQHYLTTHAGPHMEEEDFSSMTLLSKFRFSNQLQPDGRDADGIDKFIVGPAFSEILPTATGRDGLIVDLIPAYTQETYFRFINVHLESRDAFPYRAQQLKRLARALNEPGCKGGAIVGDFNAVTDEDHELLEKYHLKDAWLTLHGRGPGRPDGATYATRMTDKLYGQKRLDKVAMVGLAARRMKIIHPCRTNVPLHGGMEAEVNWSDHSGLRVCLCTKPDEPDCSVD